MTQLPTMKTFDLRPKTVQARQVPHPDQFESFQAFLDVLHDLATWVNGYIKLRYTTSTGHKNGVYMLSTVIEVPQEFGDSLLAQGGCWIVKHPNGAFEVVTDAAFHVIYIPSIP